MSGSKQNKFTFTIPYKFNWGLFRENCEVKDALLYHANTQLIIHFSRTGCLKPCTFLKYYETKVNRNHYILKMKIPL